jgi:large conductance mechanosensitive channel
MQIVHEFRKFIARGNVVDMAVGVIMGSAFTSIVNSLVNDIVTPLMSIFTGGIDFSKLRLNLSRFAFGSSPAADKAAMINYGLFINAVISFFLVSVVVFFLVKAVNRLRERAESDPTEVPVPPDIALLTEIRDLLAVKAQK